MQHAVPANVEVLPKIQRQPNLCAMVIEGEPVWVDIENIDIQVGQRAAIIDHDGSIRIQHVEPFHSDFKPMGPRTALGERYPSGYGTTSRNCVAVIGAVVNPHERMQLGDNTIEGELA